MALQIVHHSPFHWVHLRLQDGARDAFCRLSKAKQQKGGAESLALAVVFTAVSSRVVKNTSARLPVHCETKQVQHL